MAFITVYLNKIAHLWMDTS